MSVGVEGCAGFRVAKSELDRYDIAPRGDQSGGVEMTQVVKPDPCQTSSSLNLSPPIPDNVLMRGHPFVSKQPSLVTDRAKFCDVLVQKID